MFKLGKDTVGEAGLIVGPLGVAKVVWAGHGMVCMVSSPSPIYLIQLSSYYAVKLTYVLYSIGVFVSLALLALEIPKVFFEVERVFCGEGWEMGDCSVGVGAIGM